MSKLCIINTIKTKIRGNATSYIERENEIFIPKSDKFTLEQTYKIAVKKVDKINQEYLSEKFGKVVSLNTSTPNGTGIKIHPSQLLIDAYEVKEGNKSIEELNPRNLEYFNGDEALLEQEEKDDLKPFIDESKKIADEIKDVEQQGQEETTIKSGVEELFDQNPELANAVYEILGFKTLSENEVTIEKIGKDRFKITATNKTWKNIAQGRKKNMGSLEDNSFKVQELVKSIKEKGYDKSQENKSGSSIIGSKYRDNFLDLRDGKHRAVALGILFPNDTRTIEFTEGNNTTWDKKDVVNSLKENDIFLKQVSELQITPQQKQQAISKFQEYVNTTGKQDIQGFKDFVQSLANIRLKTQKT